MSIELGALVLLAAGLHASWNALLRAGADRLWSITVMCVAIALACGGLAVVVPVPARASWGCVGLSAVLHVGYNLALVRTYRTGDLGQTYPIARGCSPVLVSLGAAAFAGEIPGPASIAGVALVSGGIVSLAFGGGRIGLARLPDALLTGCFIAAYSVTDGIGVRHSGTPAGYTVWMCLLWGVTMPPVYAVMRGDWRSLISGRRETAVAAAGGLVSLGAYGIVIWAMSRGSMGPISALRETSVMFAALIGRVFLRERLPASRVVACVIVAAGAICIAQDTPK